MKIMYVHTHPVETWKSQNKTKKKRHFKLAYWEEIIINILACLIF